MTGNKHLIQVISAVIFSIVLVNALPAKTYDIGADNKRLLGSPKTHTVVKGNYFQQIAEQYNVGFLALMSANPEHDPFLPKVGTNIIIPSEMLLPFISHQGIVINLPELRLYYFSPNMKKVHVFPVGIGRQGLSTPITNTYIGEKRQDPIWRPTQKMQKRHFLEYGKYLPKEVPPGPNNPFGKYALRLGTSEYLIHGSNQRFGIGMRASSGCIRMYDDDIKWLFENVPINTKVRVINQPVKMSYENGEKRLIEIHQPLTDLKEQYNTTVVTKEMQRFVGSKREDWQRLLSVIEKPHGLVIELTK